MSLVAAQTELSTADGFRRRVVVARPAVSAAKALLAIAVFAFLYNVFSTFKTMVDHPGLNPVAVFLSTQGEDEFTSVWFTLLVWGPIVVIPLAVAFYIYARVTAQRVEHAAYLDYASNGYVATQRPLGFAAINGNTSVQVLLLSHPSVTPEAYEQAFYEISAYVSSLDKKAFKKMAASLSKIASAPQPATQLVATVPPELLLTAPIGKTEWVAVLPPAAAGGKTRYFAVKP